MGDSTLVNAEKIAVSEMGGAMASDGVRAPSDEGSEEAIPANLSRKDSIPAGLPPFSGADRVWPAGSSPAAAGSDRPAQAGAERELTRRDIAITLILHFMAGLLNWDVGG